MNNYSRKEQLTMEIARHTALKVIHEIEENGAYSNIALSDVLKYNCIVLFFGVLYL